MSGNRGPLRVGLAGFGTVGRAVARALGESRGDSLRLAGICTRRPEDARASAPWVPADTIWSDAFDTLLTSGCDVIVEVIGGVEPARAWIERALGAGLAVVTANKQVIAEHGPALVAAARANGRPLRFEAAVGGAVPVVRGLQEGLRGDRITRIAGVVNGTCNFILTEMQRRGVSLDAAVSEAQRRGFAEADPNADLDGLDARAKLSILATLGFGQYLHPGDIAAESIRAIDGGDVVAATALGRAIRQVARAERCGNLGGGIRARVGAALVPAGSWVARADGAENVVAARGERSGTTVFAGQGAGGHATAVAVLGDLLALAGTPGAPPPWPARVPSAAPADEAAAHYVRLASTSTVDSRRALAALDTAGFAVDRVLEDSAADGCRFAALLRPCPHDRLAQALDALPGIAATGSRAVALPLIDAD